MRRTILLAPCLLLAACANFASDIQEADTRCANAAETAPRARCDQVAEREIWAKELPATLLDFDTFCVRRLQLAEALDGGVIAPEQYARELTIAQRNLADAQARVYGSDQSQRSTMFPRSVLDTLVSVRDAQARADADAAVAKSLQQKESPYPTIRNTTCKRNEQVPSQVECRTANP